MEKMNSTMAFLTRRGLWRALGLASLLRALRPPELRAARLQWEAQPDARRAGRRSYRADAQIVLLSIPLVRRPGVGGGSTTWSEEAGVRLLEFTGYSLPERAAGLNRLGLIRELSRLGGDEPESIYFGLMTASPEESAAEARKALHPQSQSVLYSAIEGRVAPGDVVTTSAHFMAPAGLSATHRDDLLAMARQALSAASGKPPEFDARTTRETTFLQALAGLLQDPSREHARYVYNGRLYRLRLSATADPKGTAYFRQKRLIAPDAEVIRAEGRLRRESGGKESSFGLWVEEHSARPLPLRIEYQPRSYLRLMFETE